MPKKQRLTDDDGADCPLRSEFIDAALAKRGLTLVKSWPARPPKEKPPVRPVPGGEAA